MICRCGHNRNRHRYYVVKNDEVHHACLECSCDGPAGFNINIMRQMVKDAAADGHKLDVHYLNSAGLERQRINQQNFRERHKDDAIYQAARREYQRGYQKRYREEHKDDPIYQKKMAGYKAKYARKKRGQNV